MNQLLLQKPKGMDGKESHHSDKTTISAYIELYKGEATSLVWFMNLVDVGTG
jgi:hypothetical protein